MRKLPPQREFAFLLHDVARMMKTSADHAVRPCGMTRAQWAVLSKVERFRGPQADGIGRHARHPADHPDPADRPAV